MGKKLFEILHLVLFLTIFVLGCKFDDNDDLHGISKIAFTTDYSTQKIVEISSMELYENYYAVVYTDVELSEISVSQRNLTTGESIASATIDLTSSNAHLFYKLYGFYATDINPNVSEGEWEVYITGKDIDGNSVKSCKTKISVVASLYRVYFYSEYNTSTTENSLNSIPGGIDNCTYSYTGKELYIKVLPNTVLSKSYFPELKYDNKIFLGWADDSDCILDTSNGISIAKNNTKFFALWESQEQVAWLENYLDNLPNDDEIHTVVLESEYPDISYIRNMLIKDKYKNLKLKIDMSNCSKITSLSDLTDCSFSNCKNIYEIILPDTIQEIGYQSFYHCENLNYILIPKSLTYIGYQAFYYCKELASINYTGTINEWGNVKLHTHVESYSGYLWIDWKNGYLKTVICSDGSVQLD